MTLDHVVNSVVEDIAYFSLPNRSHMTGRLDLQTRLRWFADILQYLYINKELSHLLIYQ